MFYPFRRKEKVSNSYLYETIHRASLRTFGIKTVNTNDDYYIEPRYIKPYYNLGRELKLWKEMYPRTALFKGDYLFKIILSDGSYFYTENDYWKVHFKYNKKEGREFSKARLREIKAFLISKIEDLEDYIMDNCDIVYDPWDDQDYD